MLVAAQRSDGRALHDRWQAEARHPGRALQFKEMIMSEMFDNSIALAEGWDLFDVEGRLHLQRIDFPADHVGILDYTEPKFASDAEAVIHVALKASQGSSYHMGAIALIGQLQDVLFELPAPVLAPGTAKLEQVTLVLDVICADSTADAPDWVALAVDEDLMARIVTLSEMCRTHGLADVRLRWHVDWKPALVSGRQHDGDGFLVVSETGVWLTDSGRTSQHALKTPYMDVAEMADLVRKARAAGEKDVVLLDRDTWAHVAYHREREAMESNRVE